MGRKRKKIKEKEMDYMKRRNKKIKQEDAEEG